MSEEFNNIFRLKNNNKRKKEHIIEILERFGDTILNIADVIDTNISSIEQKVTQLENKISKIEIKAGLMNLDPTKPTPLPIPPKNFMRYKIGVDQLRTSIMSELKELFKESK
nr:MAG: hypothetical protein [uncultured archaeon]